MTLKCLTLEKITEDWAVEGVIDKVYPDQEILKIPNLHSKYCTQLAAHTLSLKMKKIEYTRKRQLRKEYYKGHWSDQQLKTAGVKQFQFLYHDDYLESDEELLKLKEQMIGNEEAIAYCTSICKELQNRTWQLREYMTHWRFLQGGKLA